MIQQEEAQELMSKFIALRQKALESDKDKILFKNHERLCIEKFMYLITMRTARYKQFHNYEDLNQEGLEALVKSMKNYNPAKGSFFWWAHKYIDTRISRSANLHTTIRYPLKVAKENIPHKEAVMPLLLEELRVPDKEMEKCQLTQSIMGAMESLSNTEQEAIKLAFGLDGDKPTSLNRISKKLNISRLNCIKTINNALLTMRENIKT